MSFVRPKYSKNLRTLIVISAFATFNSGDPLTVTSTVGSIDSDDLNTVDSAP